MAAGYLLSWDSWSCINNPEPWITLPSLTQHTATHPEPLHVHPTQHVELITYLVRTTVVNETLPIQPHVCTVHQGCGANRRIPVSFIIFIEIVLGLPWSCLMGGCQLRVVHIHVLSYSSYQLCILCQWILITNCMSVFQHGVTKSNNLRNMTYRRKNRWLSVSWLTGLFKSCQMTTPYCTFFFFTQSSILYTCHVAQSACRP